MAQWFTRSSLNQEVLGSRPEVDTGGAGRPRGVTWGHSSRADSVVIINAAGRPHLYKYTEIKTKSDYKEKV